MKLLLINSAYPKEIESVLSSKSRGGLQNAPNVFQWAVVDGLERCNVDYTLACTPVLPAWPRYKDFFTPSGEMSVNGKKRGHFLKYCTLPVLNQVTRKVVLRRYIRRWCQHNNNEDRLIVLCYTQQADQLGAAIALKREFNNLVVAPIVTDLIDNASEFAGNRRFLKRIQTFWEERSEQKLFPKVDKYILLTRQMVECIPEAKGKYLVIEGISTIDGRTRDEYAQKQDNIRTILYTGTFQEFGGLRMLVDAFLKTQDSRFRLVLCGDGVLRDYVVKATEADERILYKGIVSHDEVIRLQRESTVLINPRRPNGGITKYSFPSKTMEYMSSLTPMIGYHLEGIPKEYYPLMYTPNDLTLEALTECINQTLSLSLPELKQKAEEAYRFVTRYKNSKAQVQKILDFLFIK